MAQLIWRIPSMKKSDIPTTPEAHDFVKSGKVRIVGAESRGGVPPALFNRTALSYISFTTQFVDLYELAVPLSDQYNGATFNWTFSDGFHAQGADVLWPLLRGTPISVTLTVTNEHGSSSSTRRALSRHAASRRKGGRTFGPPRLHPGAVQSPRGRPGRIETGGKLVPGFLGHASSSGPGRRGRGPARLPLPEMRRRSGQSLGNRRETAGRHLLRGAQGEQSHGPGHPQPHRCRPKGFGDAIPLAVEGAGLRTFRGGRPRRRPADCRDLAPRPVPRGQERCRAQAHRFWRHRAHGGKHRRRHPILHRRPGRV